MKLAALIPCHNNCLTVGHVVNECLQFVENVIVIDDGSSDGSAIVASDAGATVYSFEENRGVGYALRYGISKAIQSGYETIITLDSDGAHNPKDIPALLKVHNGESCAITIGDRWTAADNRNIPSAKLWANLFASRLVNLIAGSNLPDVTCGFRVVNSTVFKEWPDGNGFEFLYQMIFSTTKTQRIGTCPVEVCYDANHLWVTKQHEILGMLSACSSHATDKNLRDKISSIERLVRKWEVLSVELFDSTGKSDLLIAHPLKDKEGYVVQKQHPIFFPQRMAETIEL